MLAKTGRVSPPYRRMLLQSPVKSITDGNFIPYGVHSLMQKRKNQIENIRLTIDKDNSMAMDFCVKGVCLYFLCRGKTLKMIFIPRFSISLKVSS